MWLRFFRRKSRVYRFLSNSKNRWDMFISMRRKESHQNAGPRATIRPAEMLSSGRKFLRFTWISALGLSLPGFLILLLFFEKNRAD